MFSVRLADHSFCIENRYSYVEELCWDYVIPETDGERITVSDEEMARERIPEEDYPPFYEESTAVYRKICEFLIPDGIFMFHASAVSIDGQGLLFAATSGMGKSTHARLWKDVFGKRAVIINDDKPLIRVGIDEIMSYGTPWSGKHSLQTNTIAPVKALFLLERGDKNSVEPVDFREAYPTVLNQAYRPKEPVLLQKTLGMVNEFMKSVPVYRLKCNISEEAVWTAYSVLEDMEN